jgi:hypothetical protein
MAVHSKIGASSMHRWSQCPGSVRLSEGIESVSSKYAEEGTEAHALAERVLRNGAKAWAGADPEMREHVGVYVDLIQRERKGNEFWIEHKFNLDNLYPGLYGTADAVIYDAKTKTLRVYDLKYGAGLAVEVERNPQLLYYALGALLSVDLPCETVETVIVQPRCPHPDGSVRRWSIPAVDLIDFGADLVKYAKATEKPDAPLVPGAWCRFCPAAGVCPATRSKAQDLAKREFSSDLSYDPKQLAETLTWLPVLEGWIESVRQFAYAEAEHGRTPPGWKLVEKRATRKWRDEDEAAKACGKLLSDDELYETKLLSPAKVEKLLGKAARDVLGPLVVTESSGLTLAPESDKRPAAKVSAADEFEAVA